MKIKGEIGWEFQHSRDCGVKRALVWAFLSDVSNWERLEGNAVEWIRLHGPFETGTAGETKMPGQPANSWLLAAVEPEHSMIVEMSLDGAHFYTRTELEALSEDQTRIIQTLILTGPKAAELAPGMKAFESNAPQGLAKMAATIEADFKK